MAKYDGLIIPRSYSEYINKTDAATHQQAHQVSGVLDAEPTENSNKAVKSGGVYDALAGKQPTLTFDNVPTEDSDNPVKSGGIYDELETKQDTLTFDNTPTANSDNPVKSGGVKSYVDGIYPDYSQIIQSGIPADGYTPQEDCYAVLRYISVRNADVSIQLEIDNNVVSTADNSSITVSGTTYKIYIVSWAGYIKAGSEVKWIFNNAATALGGITFFKLTRTTS